MRAFIGLALGAIGVAAVMVLVSHQPSALAQDYLNSPYPSERFKNQERQIEQERNDFYNRQRQQNQDQQLERRSSSTMGAIAFNPKNQEYGYSFGYSSRNDAEQRAKKECGGEGCEIAAWFENSCGAVAVGDDGVWAGGTGNNQRAAQADAMKDCASDGGKNCKVLYSRCSR